MAGFINVELGTDLFAKFDEARDGRTVSKALRDILKLGLVIEKLDPATRALVFAGIDSARHTTENFADWANDPNAREIFRRAIDRVIAKIGAEGEPRACPAVAGSAAEILFGERAPSLDEAAGFIFCWVRTEANRRADAAAFQ